MQKAQRIAVVNRGAFLLKASAKGTTKTSKETGTFGIHASKVIDLAEQGFAEGEQVHLVADAVAGQNKDGAPFVFSKNGQTITYWVGGTTGSVDVDQIGDSKAAPEGFPADIPVSFVPMENWSGEIKVAGVWTCAPKDAQDVVDVCNWARTRGYKVRPRGMMHNWSPLMVNGSTDKTLLVDLTKSLHRMEFRAASNGLPTRVWVQTGQTMEELLKFLEASQGGFSFSNTPAPGRLTVGGVLAIAGHGTSIAGGKENLPGGYGSMSNQIVELTAVVTDPANPQAPYRLKTFKRSDAEAAAFMVHLGGAFIVDATLAVVPNYNLRCENRTDISPEELFRAPKDVKPGDRTFDSFLTASGRVETIWFPFTTKPWLHVWTMAPEKPGSSRAVTRPYPFPFTDVPGALQSVFKWVFGSPLGALTPQASGLMADMIDTGLRAQVSPALSSFVHSTLPSNDMWGKSKNTLLYVEDTTLRVTANGHAVQIRRADVQEAIASAVAQVKSLLERFKKENEYPINNALEIRVNSLDDPSRVGVAGAATPALSPLRMDDVAIANGWDVAVWFNILTIPGTPSANKFYAAFEQWLFATFTGAKGRVVPEWTKGWGFSDQGAWKNAAVIQKMRDAFPAGSKAMGFDQVARTLGAHDAGGLFTNPFLQQLFASKRQPMKVLVHVQDVGDVTATDGVWAGTKGQSKRLEGFELSLTPPIAGVELEYMAHVQDVGDTPWQKSYVGTRGKSKRAEGFAVRLVGPEASKYSVHYFGHVQDVGDTPEARDGEYCGTRGQSKRLEAIQVWVERK